ncbi:hypothetical protein [Hyphomonas sp.]|uniref:hypothetical protein n=1 Tax=Hyphomonas sp. TaxID=87 RepID=UPI0032980071
MDKDFDVYWINTWNNDVLVRQGEEALFANSSFDIESFSGHSFLVVEQQVRTVWDGIQQPPG